jgi:hypothetical protein
LNIIKTFYRSCGWKNDEEFKKEFDNRTGISLSEVEFDYLDNAFKYYKEVSNIDKFLKKFIRLEKKEIFLSH